MSIGEEIRKWRNFRKTSMASLSDKSGLPASNIFLWEKNRLTPTQDELVALAKALEISVQTLSDKASTAMPSHSLEGARQAPVASAPPPSPANGTEHDTPYLNMALITEVYRDIRSKAAQTPLVELTAAKNLLNESLKIVRDQMKEIKEGKL